MRFFLATDRTRAQVPGRARLTNSDRLFFVLAVSLVSIDYWGCVYRKPHPVEGESESRKLIG